jgi:hypothetical protein
MERRARAEMPGPLHVYHRPLAPPPEDDPPPKDDLDDPDELSLTFGIVRVSLSVWPQFRQS